MNFCLWQKLPGKKLKKSIPNQIMNWSKQREKKLTILCLTTRLGIEYGERIVFFIDECHLLHGDINGYVWGRSDTRIEVPITNQKNRQTYFSALNYQTKQFHARGYESGAEKSTVECIKYLQYKYKGQRIILIWDGASYHRYGEFKDYLLSVNADKEPDNWSLTCILFAPNAPEQNPVEDIWLQANFLLRRYWYLCKSFKIVKFLERVFHQGTEI